MLNTKKSSSISHLFPFTFSGRFQQRRLHLPVGPGEDAEQTDPQRADGGRGADGVREGHRRGRPGQRRTSVPGGLPAHDCPSSRLPQVGQ